MRKTIARALTRVVRAMALEAEGALGHRTLIRELEQQALQDTAHYVRENMTEALPFSTKEELWTFVVERAVAFTPGVEPSDTVCLEFGVHKGRSLSYLSSLDPSQAWVGFDSFEGLAEDWPGIGMQKGAFDVGGVLPAVGGNVSLRKGWFADTLIPFIANESRRIRIVHLDADTYESTKYVLDTLGRERLEVGTWLIFDEYFNYNGWSKTGEYLAFKEWAEANGVSYSYRGFSEREVALEITGTSD